jgi:hypothetical protein
MDVQYNEYQEHNLMGAQHGGAATGSQGPHVLNKMGRMGD